MASRSCCPARPILRRQTLTVIPVRRKDIVADKDIDPLRTALAKAIDEQRKAEAVKVEAAAAIRRAEELIAAADVKLATATAVVADAREQDAQRAAAAIRAAAPHMATTGATKSARAAEQEAADSVDVAKAALARLQVDLQGATEAARLKTNAVAVAINGVLQPVVEALLAQAQQHKITLAICMAAAGQILDEAARYGAPLIGREQLEWLGAAGSLDLAGERITAALTAWQQALAALKKDAAAPLPLGVQS